MGRTYHLRQAPWQRRKKWKTMLVVVGISILFAILFIGIIIYESYFN